MWNWSTTEEPPQNLSSSFINHISAAWENLYFFFFFFCGIEGLGSLSHFSLIFFPSLIFFHYYFNFKMPSLLVNLLFVSLHSILILIKSLFLSLSLSLNDSNWTKELMGSDCIHCIFSLSKNHHGQIWLFFPPPFAEISSESWTRIEPEPELEPEFFGSIYWCNCMYCKCHHRHDYLRIMVAFCGVRGVTLAVF